MNKLFAAARTSMCCGMQSPSLKCVCSIAMCVPRSTRAKNRPIENAI